MNLNMPYPALETIFTERMPYSGWHAATFPSLRKIGMNWKATVILTHCVEESFQQ